MVGELCPYCGTLLTTSLKFCVNCRRSVTEDKIKQANAAGIRSTQVDEDEFEEGAKEKRFRLSKGTSYDSLRSARTFFMTITTLVSIVFVYYFTMKFVIHEPIPFEQEISNFISDFQKQHPLGKTP